MNTNLARAGLLTAYLATILIANWTVAHVGIVPVGFGLAAPAAVYIAGLAFTLRDLLHEAAGRWAVVTAIGAGTILSVAVSTPRLAAAAGAAFAISELADLAVYEPLRRRRWLLAVTASNLAGLIIDSILFLTLAFGSLTYLPGQIIGKTWVTIVAVTLLATGRHYGRRRAQA